MYYRCTRDVNILHPYEIACARRCRDPLHVPGCIEPLLSASTSRFSPHLFSRTKEQKVRHKLRIPEPAHSERPTPPHCFASPALSHFARTVARKLIISIKQSRALVFANRGIGQNKTVRTSLQTRQAVSVSLPFSLHLRCLFLFLFTFPSWFCCNQSARIRVRHHPTNRNALSSRDTGRAPHSLQNDVGCEIFCCRQHSAALLLLSPNRCSRHSPEPRWPANRPSIAVVQPCRLSQDSTAPAVSPLTSLHSAGHPGKSDAYNRRPERNPGRQLDCNGRMW